MTYEYYRVMRTVADRMRAKHDAEVPVGANRPSNMLQMDPVISKLKAFRPMLLQNTTDIARVANNLKALQRKDGVKRAALCLWKDYELRDKFVWDWFVLRKLFVLITSTGLYTFVNMRSDQITASHHIAGMMLNEAVTTYKGELVFGGNQRNWKSIDGRDLNEEWFFEFEQGPWKILSIRW